MFTSIQILGDESTPLSSISLNKSLFVVEISNYRRADEPELSTYLNIITDTTAEYIANFTISTLGRRSHLVCTLILIIMNSQEQNRQNSIRLTGGDILNDWNSNDVLDLLVISGKAFDFMFRACKHFSLPNKAI